MTINRWGLALTGLLLAAGAGAGRAQGLADYDYSNLAFRGMGLSWGYIWPTKVQATPLYSLRLDLGYLGPGVRIAPTLSYWNSQMRRSELDRFAASINAIPALRAQGATITGADLAPVRWSDLALDIDGEYVVRTPSGVLAYAGVGLGVHALNGGGAAIDNTFVEDLLDTIAPALTGLAGLEVPFGPRFRVFGEMRLTAMGDIQYGGLRAGVALMAPGHPPGQSSTPGPAPAPGPSVSPDGGAESGNATGARGAASARTILTTPWSGGAR
jgi:hypothetical protein